MKKYTLLAFSILSVALIGFGLSACKDDDEPVNPKLSIQSSGSASEDDEDIQVTVSIDQAIGQDITVFYDLKGTAKEGSATTGDYRDEDDGEVVIPAGSTTARIHLTIHDDAVAEGDETVIITLTEANPSSVIITEDDETTITIEDNESPAVVSFSDATALNKTEGDEKFQVEVVLSGPVGSDVSITYAIGGTAIDSISGWENETGSDYFIDAENAGTLVIPKGETSGTIGIQIYTDLILESQETITLTLSEVTGAATLGTAKTKTINVRQQNGRVVLLNWANDLQVDMDLFYWMGELGSAPDELGGINAFRSVVASFNGVNGEGVFIPDNLPDLFLDSPDASFGFSYVYWGVNGGPTDPGPATVPFKVTFIDFVNGAAEAQDSREVFDATYTTENINRWDEETGTFPPAIVQTYDKQDGSFVNVSQISVPGSGSRVRTPRQSAVFVPRSQKVKPAVF